MNLVQLDFGDVIHLDDLTTDFEVSVRTYNVCSKHGLLELPRLIEFYVGVEDFTLLEGAGRKTHQELEKICKYFLHHQSLVSSTTLESQRKQEEQVEVSIISPSNLSLEHQVVLEAFVRQKFISLSIRGQNALQTFLVNQVSYSTLHHSFYEEGTSAIKIRNVGAKTLTELETFLTELKHFAKAVADKRGDELIEEFLIGQVSQIFDLKPDFWEDFRPQMQLKRFPLFKFLEKLILGNRLFQANRTIIARRRFGWFNDESELNLEQIGQILDLTRERVRQIAVGMTETLPEKLKFLSTFKKQILELSGGYGVNMDKDLLFVRKTFVNDVNQIEDTDFSPRFFVLVFSFLHADTHLLFGHQFDFFKYHYLISRECNDLINFEVFVKNIRDQTQERIEVDYPLDLDGFLYQFLIKSDISTLPLIRPVCEDLLILEFGDETQIEPSGTLVFRRNTKKHVWEYALKALEIIGGPANLAKIYQTIVTQYPDFDTTIEGLRTALIKEKKYFIYFGRSSTYGLAHWETEFDDIKGGTIRDIAEEYLQQFSYPRHVFDITDYVLRFRPDTTPRSVHGNLQADESRRFREFLGKFWGLTESKYNDFKVQLMSNHTLTYLVAWINLHHDSTVDQAIEYLSELLQVQSVQVKAWLDEKVRSGTLRFENNKIILAK